jgi:UDP-4-amino-4,6-dideoxy-N-acetyl-beta-L-altrosamine transaminase
MNLPYGRPVVTKEDIEAVTKVLSADYLTMGPAVKSFEKTFASKINADQVYAVANGTAALHVAMLALGIGEGDKVLTVSNTWLSTANAALFCGAEVEFVDIDEENLSADVDEIEKKLKQKAKGYYKAVTVVDFAGYPLDLKRLRSLCDQYGSFLIEDAAHALGAERDFGQGLEKIANGKYAHITTHSFHPVKHITTGEGGVVVTSIPELAEKMKLFRNHGFTRKQDEFLRAPRGGWDCEMQVLGYNYRLSDILCALGESQVKRLEGNLKRRREIAKFYDHELKGVVQTPATEKGTLHAYHIYAIQTAKRNELYKFLNTKKIYPQVHYVPVHTHPYYEERYGKISLPKTEAYFERTLSIPMYHALTDENVQYVVKQIKDWRSEIKL